MSFVAIPKPTPSDTPAPALPAQIVNSGFFPDLDPTEIRASADIPTSIAPAQLRASIIAAMLAVNQDLASWADRQKAAGWSQLADLPADTVDGQSALVWRYARAVALYAKAELIERQRDFDTTGTGGQRIEDLGGTIVDLRRDALHLIRDLLGIRRTTIELI